VTNDEHVEEIRERLAKATPGPWFKTANWYVSSDEDYSIYNRDGRWCGGHDPLIAQIQGPGIRRGEDFDLIAAAPSDLAFLLSELDRARKVVEAARQAQALIHGMVIVGKTHQHETRNTRQRLDAALFAYDAPTENK
jgi:hypothetical protein